MVICVPLQLDDNEYSIPHVDMMPSLESVLSELDADSDIISDVGDRFTPTPSLDDRPKSGTMLRHIILQGVSAQMASASVNICLAHTYRGQFLTLSHFSLRVGSNWRRHSHVGCCQ